MTAYQIEANACTGRGFSGVDANGFCAKLKTYVPKSYASGGPAWYILDDQSSASNPYIVISDQVSPTPNSRARIIQIMITTATPATVSCYCWFYWNSSSHVGTGNWSTFSLNTVDSGTFGYDFRGGPEFMWIASFVAGAITYGCVETFQAVSTFLEAETVIGTLQGNFFKDSGNSSGYLSGFQNITGITYTSGNTDSGFNLFFSIVSDGGSNVHIDVFKDSLRTQKVAHSGSFVNSTTGPRALTLDNASGIGGSVTNPIAVVVNSTISCRFLQVDLETGAGARFTSLNSYYMFDAQTASSTLVSYLRVMAISGDTLTLEKYTAGKNFLSGAVIGAYPHRFFALFSHRFTSTANGAGLRLPYTCSFGNEYTDQISNTATCEGDLIGDFPIIYCVTDPLGNYYEQGPLLLDFTNSVAATMTNPRPYGVAKNLKFTNSSGLSVYTFGRTLSSVNWLDIQHKSITANSLIGNFATVVPISVSVRDTGSLT